ncbi:MAG: hypothetical protein PHE25_02160 [Candidatus Gracilibacteria bacterium]|nr:hypothetical protein [Candidatus Gracilibacteria bacterium]
MNKKIINNAISAYLGLAILLILPSKKENINHPFIKNHAKTALFIHFLMLISYLTFVTYGLFGNFYINNFGLELGLNHIIVGSIFFILFGFLIFGVFKAYSGNEFSILDIATISKTDKIIEFKNSNLNEQGILTIILSLIPFLGFTIKGKFKNYKSPILENNIKLNLIISFIISLLFVYLKSNLGLIFVLGYIIFIVYYSILIVIRKSVITFNLNKIKTFEELYILYISLIKYLYNYFSGKTFVNLEDLKNQVKNKIIQKNDIDKQYLSNLKESKLPDFIAYIPIINLISLFDINSKNRFHIVNGIILTIICVIFYYFGLNNYLILVLFPIFFGIGYLKNIEYKFPFLFDIYNLFSFIFSKIFGFGKKVKEMKNEVREVNFSIEEEKSEI